MDDTLDLTGIDIEALSNPLFQDPKKKEESSNLDLSGIDTSSLFQQPKTKKLVKKPQEELNLEGIDTSSLLQKPIKKTEITGQVVGLNLEGIDTSSFEKVISEATPVDPLGISDFTLADNSRYSWIARGVTGWTQSNKPVILGKNPQETSNPIIVVSKGKALNISDATDIWLNSWKPEYKVLNDKYRKETSGLSIMDVGNPGSIVSIGNPREYKYKIQARPTREIQALFEAYKTGGLPALYATQRLATTQRESYIDEYNKAIENLEKEKENHPYLKELISYAPSTFGEAPRAGLGIAVNPAFQDFMMVNAQLYENVKNLGKAIWIGNTKGYNSDEYLELIEQEQRNQNLLNVAKESIPPASTFGQKALRGIVGGTLATPKFIAADAIGGPYALPILVYFEELNRGNIDATKTALPMAIMTGVGRGLGQYLNAPTKNIARDYIQAKDLPNFEEAQSFATRNGLQEVTPESKVYLDQLSPKVAAEINPEAISREFIATDAGAGNSAAFRRVPKIKDNPFFKERLSILTDELAKGRNLSIAQLTPFERQLVLRGTNAFTLAGTSLITNPKQTLSDTISNLIVGGSFPVGESPSKVKFPAVLPEESVTTSKTEIIKRLGLEPARVNVPLEPSKILSGDPRGVSTTYLPSGEAPANIYKEREYSSLSAGSMEKGFEAQTTGASVHLPLEEAAFHYLDLERSLKDGSYKNKNDNMQADLKKQMAIQTAMDTLKTGMSDEVLEFYRQNEKPIRSAIRGNYDLQGQKLKKQNPTISDVKPIGPPEPNPIKTGQESSSEVLGKIGLNNEGSNQEDAMKVFRDIVDKASVRARERGSFSTKPLEGKGIAGQTAEEFQDILKKAKSGLDYVSAFFIEDLYHRGIPPSLEQVKNRIKVTLGEYGKYLPDDLAREVYNNGLNYFNANQADTFFSKMKQDASEKLPNKFTSDQARNVINQYSNEREWTVGLEDFLKENEGKKINKQDLVDVINRGQVRVEASVASEEAIAEVDRRIAALRAERNSINIGVDSVEEQARIDKQLDDFADRKLELQREKSNLPQVQFSLKAYTGEKLELPGATDSKEVKLITPLVKLPIEPTTTFEEYLQKVNIDKSNLKFSEVEPAARKAYDNFINQKRQELNKVEPRYTGGHWGINDVVAHYRSTFRTTLDSLRTYFSEEFQSDWNHDIREKGVKVPFTQEMANRYAALKSILDYGKPTTEERQEFNRLDLVRTNVGGSRIEPNPFMANHWKELVFKRFLRDGVIEKDENGNYKHDGIGWTTARQQVERYGGILEGKEFKWQKNSDGTYSFDMFNNGEWVQSHEIKHISLERFEELTTKEATQEVRDQETNLTKHNKNILDKIEEGKNRFDSDIGEMKELKGQFSLKEAVELRSGIGEFSDYDDVFVNYAKKIGKRFGAKYYQKEIDTGTTKIIGEGDNEIEAPYIKFEKIHYLEITPSMRESLLKEGLPLYGMGKSKPLKNSEIGIRNRITTQQAFDEHRNQLITELEREQSVNSITGENKIGGTTFNSGLSPDALIDSLKLQWQDVKDFAQFSTELVKRFGDAIKPYLQDLYVQVKGFAGNINNGLDALDSYITQGKDSPVFKARQLKGTKEEGILGLNLKKAPTNADLAADKYRESRKQIPFYEWYSLWRGVGLAQTSTEFGQVYDVLRGGQRTKNSFEWTVLEELRKANDLIQHGAAAQAIADTIWIGNETQKLFTNTELKAGDKTTNRPALSPEQIQAYRHVRNALDVALDIRRDTKLYTMRQKATNLNEQLKNATPNAPEYDAIISKMIDLNSSMNDVYDHFEQLKKEGYISTQRIGPIAAYAEDPTQPLTITRTAKNGRTVTEPNPKATFYSHFDTVKDAKNWLDNLERQHNAVNMKISDVRKPADLKTLTAKMTPGQFEDFIDSAGVNPKAPEIEKLRDEVYSRYPSYGYELKRDYVRGYDRTWEFAIESIAHQTEIYASSFYSRVAGEEALKKLESLDLQNKKPALYATAQKYIDHEISSPAETGLAAHLEKYAPGIADKLPSSLRRNLSAGGIRKGVYMFQLGYDINQLYLNALAQPITQTYNYFSRVEHNGERLKGFEPEKYFTEAGALTSRLGKEYLQQKVDKSYSDSKIPQDFRDILDRLTRERVIEPEFNRSLLELESERTAQTNTQNVLGTGKNILKRALSSKQREHWAGVFMRMGEKTTRTHVAAEAYLVGKEKFGMAGEELTDFIVRAVDATQSNPTRAENPLIVRGGQNTGEVRKLLYQFNAFNHMWLENLLLNVKADFKNRNINATSRQLVPLALMGGMRGLPLAGISAAIFTSLTGEDPKKHLDKYLGKDSMLESFALYGVPAFTPFKAALSQRLTPSVPFVDQIKINNSIRGTISDTFSSTNVPALATGVQIARGFSDLLQGNKLRAVSEAFPIKPIRTAATAARYYNEGIRTRANRTLVPKSKVTTGQLVGATIGLQPTPVIENYEKIRTKNAQTIHKNVVRPLVRKIQHSIK